MLYKNWYHVLMRTGHNVGSNYFVKYSPDRDHKYDDRYTATPDDERNTAIPEDERYTVTPGDDRNTATPGGDLATPDGDRKTATHGNGAQSAMSTTKDQQSAPSSNRGSN